MSVVHRVRSSAARRALVWIAMWLALSAFSTVAHVVTWMSVDDAAAAGADSWTVKVVSNLLTVPTAPGWITMTRLNGALDGQSIPFALAASLIGWVPWLVIAWVALWARRRWRCAPAPARSSEPPVESLSSVGRSRRRLIADVAGIGAVAASGGVYGYAVVAAPWQLRVRTLTVPIRGLPAELDGLVIAHVSDTHYGPRVPAEHVRESVRMALAMKPDVVALVGDYIHNGQHYVSGGTELLKPLFDTGRCVAVMGNHDNYFGAGPAVRKALIAGGALLLDNAAAFVTADRRIVRQQPASPCVAIVGVGDLLTEPVLPAKALAGIDDNTPRVMLSHNPDVAEHAELVDRATGNALRRVDLMLSGHTHGGQVSLPLLGTPIVPSAFGSKYASGLNQGPAFPVITSNGIGVSILPIRFGVPPEVVKVVLTRA